MSVTCCGQDLPPATHEWDLYVCPTCDARWVDLPEGMTAAEAFKTGAVTPSFPLEVAAGPRRVCAHGCGVMLIQLVAGGFPVGPWVELLADPGTGIDDMEFRGHDCPDAPVTG